MTQAPQSTRGRLNQCPFFKAAHSEIMGLAGRTLSDVAVWSATGSDEIAQQGREVAGQALTLQNALSACALCQGEIFTDADVKAQECPTAVAVFDSAIKGENYFDQFKPTIEG